MNTTEALSLLKSLLVTDSVDGHALSTELKEQAQKAIGIIAAVLPATDDLSKKPKKAK